MQSFGTGVCAGVFSAALLFAVQPAGEATTHDTPEATFTGDIAEKTFHVEVLSRDNSGRPGSVRTPEFVRVRTTLRPVLSKLLDASQAFGAVRGALSVSFPGRVTEESMTTRYKAVWCPEIRNFKIICCQAIVFEVALGHPVLVPVEVQTTL